MLVLTRRVGQRLQIGPDIVVTVLEVSGERVRVGVEAPASYKVLREEIVTALASENQLAASAASKLPSTWFAPQPT